MKHEFKDHSPECCNPKFPPFCPEDKPPMGRPPMPPCAPMPPCPSVVSGMDLYEAVNHLTDRVNVCIHNYNAVMSESYKTLHNLQQAAQENGAYYGADEVWVEEGYYANESSTYHLVHKACVDRRGEPIRMQLHLAYGNTTNSKIEQGIFNASKVEFADKMLVAIPKSENGWYGKAIWHGAPIQSADAPTLYTVGFTRAGVMRVYNNGVSVDQMLRDTIENAMGCSGVLIQNGQVTDDSYRANIPNAGQQTSRVCIGQNLDTREVIMLTVGNENDVNRKGLTSKACAEILLGQGCDIAVELCEGVGSAAMDKGSLMYVPDDEQQPNAYAFWFISRKCFYKTDYERELAELIQNYGACIWDEFLNKKNIESVKNDLDAEIARAVAAENALGERVTEEVTRATGEEQRIEGKLDTEIQRAKDAEAEIHESVNDETLRAKAEEQRIDAKVDAEVKRATGVEDELDVRIEGEVVRAKAEERRIDEKVDTETARAKGVEAGLQSALDKEVHDRTNADSALHQEILTEQGERTAADTVLQNNINSEASTRATEDGKLQASIDAEVQTRASEDSKIRTELGGKIEALTGRVTQCETDIHQLNSLTSQMQQQMSGLDKSVSDMLVTVSKLETAMENVKQTVLSMNTIVQECNAKVERLNTKVDGMTSGQTVLPYVKKDGDTMTGALVMADSTGAKGSVAVANDGVSLKAADGAFVKVDDSGFVSFGDNVGSPARLTGVADGVDDNDAVNKGQLGSVDTTANKANREAMQANADIAEIVAGTKVLPYVKETDPTLIGTVFIADPNNHNSTSTIRTDQSRTHISSPDSNYIIVGQNEVQFVDVDSLTGVSIIKTDTGGGSSLVIKDAGIEMSGRNYNFELLAEANDLITMTVDGTSPRVRIADGVAYDEAVSMQQLGDVKNKATNANITAGKASEAASAADTKATQASAAASAADTKATQASAAASAADTKATQASDTANAAKTAADDAATEAAKASADVAEIVAGTKVLPYVKPVVDHSFNLPPQGTPVTFYDVAGRPVSGAVGQVAGTDNIISVGGTVTVCQTSVNFSLLTIPEGGAKWSITPTHEGTYSVIVCNPISHIFKGETGVLIADVAVEYSDGVLKFELRVTDTAANSISGQVTVTLIALPKE